MNEYPVPPLVSDAKVLYIGGLNSSGTKAYGFACDGYQVTMPSSSGGMMASISAFAAKFGMGGDISEIRKQCLNCTKPDIMVGSSQGGAVAMSLQQDWPGVPTLLIAPAWRTFGVKPLVSKDTVILHGRQDWLVPAQDSKVLQHRNKCKLMILDDNHPLDASYEIILQELDKLSVATGKHKPDDVIRKEWWAYHEECRNWLLNCTKVEHETNNS